MKFIEKIIVLLFDIIAFLFKSIFTIIALIFSSNKKHEREYSIESSVAIESSYQEDVFRHVKDLLKEKKFNETIIELNRLSQEQLSVFDETKRQNYYRRTFEGLGMNNTAFYNAVLKRLFFTLGRSETFHSLNKKLYEEESYGTIFFSDVNEDKEFKRLYKKCSFTESYEELLHNIDEALGIENHINDKLENAVKPEFREIFKSPS